MWEKTRWVKVYVTWFLVQSERVGLRCVEEMDVLQFNFS